MLICVTAKGDNLEAEVDPRFGRCAYFIIVDTESLKFKAMANPNAVASGGAGIQSSQLIAGEKVEAVVTGNVGPNAYQTLSSLGIKIFIGASGLLKRLLFSIKRASLRRPKTQLFPKIPGNK